MKKITALVVVFTFFIGANPATAATKIKIDSQNKISQKTRLVTFKVSGLPTANGIYVSQCMAPDEPGVVPTACNPASKSKVWISDLASDLKQGAKSSKGKITLKVDKYFKDGDCIHTTCVLYVFNDHNAASDRSQDQMIEFKFGGLRLF